MVFNDWLKIFKVDAAIPQCGSIYIKNVQAIIENKNFNCFIDLNKLQDTANTFVLATRR